MGKIKSKSIFLVGFLFFISIWVAGPGCKPVEENTLLRHTWLTFFGGSGLDGVLAVALDTQGNILVAGISAEGWGTPVIPHQGDGENDVFIAKFDTFGRLVWHTFFGGAGEDQCTVLLVDQNDNIFLAGTGTANWGNPVLPNSGLDACVVKLNVNGQILWNTFLGSGDEDLGNDLALDRDGNLLLTGSSKASWGTPIRPHAGLRDGFIAKLDTNGIVQWSTFLGSIQEDICIAVTVDDQNNIYVGGQGETTWGNPINGTSGNDGFVARLNTNGNLAWNTFFDNGGFEEIWDIVCDQDNNLLMAVNDKHYQVVGGGLESVYLSSVAKMTVNGEFLWSIPIGLQQDNRCRAITIDAGNNIYVVGDGVKSWGDPVFQFHDGADAFAAKINSDGQLLWNTFMGGNEDDFGYGIVINNAGEIYIGGSSMSSWGNPLNFFEDRGDGFLTKIQISQE